VVNATGATARATPPPRLQSLHHLWLVRRTGRVWVCPSSICITGAHPMNFLIGLVVRNVIAWLTSRLMNAHGQQNLFDAR
jgi:hypothetical protein